MQPSSDKSLEITRWGSPIIKKQLNDIVVDVVYAFEADAVAPAPSDKVGQNHKDVLQTACCWIEEGQETLETALRELQGARLRSSPRYSPRPALQAREETKNGENIPSATIYSHLIDGCLLQVRTRSIGRPRLAAVDTF